jgi:hypothetical protein
LVNKISSVDAICSASFGPVVTVRRREGLNRHQSLEAQSDLKNVLDKQSPLNGRTFMNFVIIGIDRFHGIEFRSLLHEVNQNACFMKCRIKLYLENHSVRIIVNPFDPFNP